MSSIVLVGKEFFLVHFQQLSDYKPLFIQHTYLVILRTDDV